MVLRTGGFNAACFLLGAHMELSTYPESQIQDRGSLHYLTGSYGTSSDFGGADQVISFFAARGACDHKNDQLYKQLLNSLSRYKLEPFRFKPFKPLVFDTAARNNTAYNYYQYGDSITYGSSIVYGQKKTVPFVAYPLPAECQGIGVLTNRISEASVTLTAGVDFLVVPGAILFREDPALDAVLDEGKFTLWANGVMEDHQDLRNQFGYVIGRNLPSSNGFKQLLNAEFDLLVGGSNETACLKALAAACDAPICLSAGEVVQQIKASQGQMWIVTDQNAYRANPASTLKVAVGDVLTEGQLLNDAITVYQFNRGTVPSTLKGIPVPETIAGLQYGGLFFENKKYSPTITVPLTGYTRFEFPILGEPEKVKKFWDDVHAAGVAANQTLAMLLDQRTVKDSRPTAIALPTVVNPAEFLATNLLRNNGMLIVLKPTSFGANDLDISIPSILRNYIPPHVCVLTYVTLATAEATITMKGASGIGFDTDSARVFDSASTSETAQNGATLTETVFVTTQDGRCHA